MDKAALRELADQLICHPASRSISETEQAGEAIKSLLAEIQSLTEERTAWRTTAENAEAELVNARKQMEAQKDEWLSWEAKRSDLEKDAKRLDYIQKNARNDPKMDGNHVWWPTTFNKALKGLTIRSAIDAAMKEEK